jgi:hypothetical protein
MIIYFISGTSLVIPPDEVSAYFWNIFKWFNITMLASILYAVPITSLSFLLSVFMADLTFFTARFSHIIEKHDL